MVLLHGGECSSKDSHRLELKPYKQLRELSDELRTNVMTVVGTGSSISSFRRWFKHVQSMVEESSALCMTCSIYMCSRLFRLGEALQHYNILIIFYFTPSSLSIYLNQYTIGSLYFSVCVRACVCVCASLVMPAMITAMKCHNNFIWYSMDRL